MHLLATSFLRGGGTFSRIAAGPRPCELGPAEWAAPEFSYVFRGRRQELGQFLTDHCVTGLLILRDRQVLLEEYAGGNRPSVQWNGSAMSAFALMLLMGAALRDGAINSIDDLLVEYLGGLAGSAYAEVALRDLLRMSTGVAWIEHHSHPGSNLAVMEELLATEGTGAFLRFMRERERVAAPGERFRYSSGEVQLAGMVLRAATGRTLADYLSTRIWVPFGMESDAYWRLTRADDLERAWCCLCVTLRDWGRLGLVALKELESRPTGLLADGWMDQVTTPGAASPAFGCLVWLTADGLSVSGIYGQRLHVDPLSRLVIVILSRWPESVSGPRLALQNAFISQVVQRVRAL